MKLNGFFKVFLTYYYPNSKFPLQFLCEILRILCGYYTHVQYDENQNNIIYTV